MKTGRSHFLLRGLHRFRAQPGSARAADVGGGECAVRANVIGGARQRQLARMTRGERAIALAGGSW